MKLNCPTSGSKNSPSNFFLLYLNNTWAPAPKQVWLSKTSRFSSLCRPELLFQHYQDHQRVNVLYSSIVVIEKTTTAVNGIDYQKTVNVEKELENGIFVFSRQYNFYPNTRCKKKNQRRTKTRSKVRLQWHCSLIDNKKYIK